MNEQQAVSIIQAATSEFKMIFKTEPETTRALTWMNVLLQFLTADYYGINFMGQGVILTPNVLPVSDKEFCEVLRVLANVLEAKIDVESK